MDAQLHMIEEPQKQLGVNPLKFAMWLFIAAVVMMFASLTSAYIVRQAEGNWLLFELPSIMWVNSGFVVISSIFMQWAYIAAKRDNLTNIKIAITGSLIFGIAFLIGQFMAWGELVSANVYMVGNPSGSFVYVLTGIHGVHIISGIIFLLIVMWSSFKFKVHSKNMTQIEMCTTYWHFLSGLWLYLFIFLLLYR